MSALTFVVEGPFDAAVLRKLLPDSLNNEARYFAAGGRSSLTTIGRNILVHEGGPLLVVKDADTTNLELAEESRALTMAALRSVAPHQPVEVFAFVPEIEAVFIEAVPVIKKLLNGTIAVKEVLARGSARPKAVLAELVSERARRDIATWIEGLSRGDWEAIRTGEQASRFLAVVESLRNTSVAQTVA